MKRFRINADTVFIAVLVIAPVIFFWKALFLKHDLFYDDIQYVFYNMRSLLYSMGLAGRLFLRIPRNSIKNSRGFRSTIPRDPDQ